MMRLRWSVPLLLGCCVLLVSACGGGNGAHSPKLGSAPHLGQTADQLLAGLKAKGLPVGSSFTYTASNDPNNLLGRPGQYISKDNFNDTRITTSDTGADISVSDGGAIETFANATDAQKRFKYLQSISTSGSPLFAEYEYLDGAAILRVSSQLTPDEAAAYQSAFKALP